MSRDPHTHYMGSQNRRADGRLNDGTADPQVRDRRSSNQLAGRSVTYLRNHPGAVTSALKSTLAEGDTGRKDMCPYG